MGDRTYIQIACFLDEMSASFKQPCGGPGRPNPSPRKTYGDLATAQSQLNTLWGSQATCGSNSGSLRVHTSSQMASCTTAWSLVVTQEKREGP